MRYNFMLDTKSQRFANKIESLSSITDFVHIFASRSKLDKNIESEINLLIEELFTNQVKYNPKNPSVDIALQKRENRIIITFSHKQDSSFDPREVKADVKNLSLQERSAGGLGLQLVQAFADAITYKFENNVSATIIVKHLE